MQSDIIEIFAETWIDSETGVEMPPEVLAMAIERE